LVTHDPRAAERAERLLHLEKGQLVEAAGALSGAGLRSHASPDDRAETAIRADHKS